MVLNIGNRFVVIKDPDTIKHLLRVEGKYPARNIMKTNGLLWLKTHKTKLPASLVEL